jgi:hypothetical protein
VKEWIETLCPGASNQREAVRTLLGSLIAAEGSRWRSSLSAGDGRDSCAERLERFLGLRSDLDRNVNPELILEGALQALRRFP